MDIRENDRQSILYEYKDVTVNRKLELQWEDGFKTFGWELVKSAPARQRPVWLPLRIALIPFAIFPGLFFIDMVKGGASDEKTELRWKRISSIPNKNELNRLQGHFETIMDEMEHLERTKWLGAQSVAVACGLIGAVFMTLALFSYWNLAAHIAFAVPGFVMWIAGGILYFWMKKRGIKHVESEMARKTANLNDICAEAYTLL